MSEETNVLQIGPMSLDPEVLQVLIGSNVGLKVSHS